MSCSLKLRLLVIMMRLMSLSSSSTPPLVKVQQAYTSSDPGDRSSHRRKVGEHLTWTSSKSGPNKDLYTSLNSAAVVIECTKGRGRLWCSFPEASLAACSYRGELLGLMAIHLLLLAINEANPTLSGSVHIYSDCLGALHKQGTTLATFKSTLPLSSLRHPKEHTSQLLEPDI
jgi:hypothetical protein